MQSIPIKKKKFVRVVHDWELSQFTIIEFLYSVGVVLGWLILEVYS